MTDHHRKIRTEAWALAEHTIRRAWGWRNRPLKEFQRMLGSYRRGRREINYIAATLYVLMLENTDLAQTVDDFNEAAQHHSDAAWDLKEARGVLKSIEWCFLGSCPVCGEDHSSGHLDDNTMLERGPCKLAKNLPPEKK